MNFKKITAIGTSVLIAGMTMGLAAAATYPAPFVQNGAGDFAVVYGTGAGVSPLDYTNADSLADALSAKVTSTVSAGTIKLTDTEIVLGGGITGGKIPATVEDNKLSGLRDTKFSWDDGTGSQEYDFHEEITIGTMEVLTSVDDPKLEGVALSNEQALTYKFVFEEAFDTTAVGAADADTLYLEIMGVEYEIEDMTAGATDSITVTTSEQKSMAIGDTYTVEGKTVKVEDIFDGSVEISVDGVTKVINDAATVKVNGLKVKVESIGYHSNTPESSKTVLKIGKDLSKVFEDGDEFVGEDSDDPLWVWDIDFTADTLSAGDYIGVTYNAKIDSANDEIAGDSIKYIGNGYVFPNNYAAVTLDEITDAKYQGISIYFEESMDLFDDADGSTALYENKPVMVIEAEEEDSITVNSIETDTMYVYYDTVGDEFLLFYRDLAGDFAPINKPRLADDAGYSVDVDGAMPEAVLATIAVGDTDLTLSMSVTAGVASLIVDHTAGAEVLELTLGGGAFDADTATGTLEGLGANLEDAEALDISFGTVDYSTKEYEYMDAYGIILAEGTTVKAQADADEVTLSVPEEQVYATVTVSMGEISEEAETGAILVKDSEVASVATKNLIVVGGSCINSAAATLVGGAKCGDAWTAATNAGAGKFVIRSYSDNDLTSKLAVLVAGYDVADTTNAVEYFKNKVTDTSKNYLGTTATTAEVVVA